MTPANKQTMFSLITISVHCRDVIKELVQNKVTSTSDFTWHKHLRYQWDAQVSFASGLFRCVYLISP